MIIRRLTCSDKDAFTYMNKTTTDSLSDKSFLIPFSTEEIENTFANDTKDIVYGIFDEEKLVAMSGIYFDLRDFEDVKDELNIDIDKTAEIGGSMTLTEFRGNGYMLILNTQLKVIAEELNIKFILATAHPQNIASNRSLSKLGMQLIKEFDRHGYRRNLYILTL